MYVPVSGADVMPTEAGDISLRAEGKDEPLRVKYNPKTRRIYGLTGWYRSIGAEAGTRVLVGRISGQVYGISKASVREKKGKPERPPTLIDLSGLLSREKGDIVEDRIKDLILLHGQGLLSVFKPVTDARGVDLVVVKSGIFQPIFLQVKSRFKLLKSGSFLMDIRGNFQAHHAFYVVGAHFDTAELEIAPHLLLVPTEILVKKARRVKAKSETLFRYRVVTALSPDTRSKWKPYVIEKSELANKLLEKFTEIERYIR